MNYSNLVTRIVFKKLCHPFVTSKCLSTSTGPWFSLTEDQRNIADLAEKFAREEMIPKAAYHDQTTEFPIEIFKKAREVGLVNISLPSEYGGAGLTEMEQCLVNEKLAYGCSGINIAVGANGLGLTPVELYGTEEQKKEYIGRITGAPADKPQFCAFAVTEPGTGSDVAGVRTRAERTKDGDYLLNGQKMWITNGGVANWYFVLARTDANPKAKKSEAFTGFIVEKDTPGITVGRKEVMMGQRCSDTRGITFENVLIPIKNVLAKEGMGFQVAMNTFEKTRAGVGANSVGLAQRALDEATAYAFQRKTFGLPIAAHQAVQFLLADLAIGIETARIAYQRAVWEQTNGNRVAYWSSIAKCLGADIANKAATDAVQIFGGAGFNSEYPVEKLMRDAKIFQIYEGTSQIQRMIIAKDHYNAAQGKA